jgi:alpha-mannosidase
MRIAGVTSTDLFGGTRARPAQLIAVTVAADGPDAAAQAGQPVTIAVHGPGVTTPEPAVLSCPAPGQSDTAEVSIEIAAPATPGGTRPVTVTAVLAGTGQHAEQQDTVTVAEPGWTMWMVSHFHYDPVWWSTQGEFTQARIFLPEADGSVPDVRTAFELVRLHLAKAREDPDYKFVLAEIDYLKPHFDAHPEDREDLLALIAAGRIEITGGTYNEPNTNLTSAESTIRNAVSGLAYQREALGADPRTAWMLDSFGHDPGFPGLMAAAGLTESGWARGPFHQWGPNRTVGDNRRMQFASEFEWLSPDGGGLLTSYMANHYGAGWVTHQAASVAAAQQAALAQFRELAPVAATPNVLLPVGADHVIPSRWVTGIHREWNARYVWPRFVTAVPSEFFAAVRADAAARDVWITPQTRDMNPVYTGKDVSYIDTKQAQRAAEIAVEDGERLATLAWLAGADYPLRSLDKAWRLLVFGAHHDAITGTESDQVYLDLLAGWREAWDRGVAARDAATGYLAGLADTTVPATTVPATTVPATTGPDAMGSPATEPAAAGADVAVPVLVFNTLSVARPGLVRVTFTAPDGWGAPGVALSGDDGQDVPCLAEGARAAGNGTLAEVTLTFRAAGVPALGYRTYWARPAASDPAQAGWQDVAGAPEISNERFTVVADPARGGTLSQVTDRRTGAGLLAGPGNELIAAQEYPQHPRWNEGPWLLVTRGERTGSAGLAAEVRAQRSPAGARLVATFALGDLRVTQETLLWDGSDRVEFRSHVDGSIGQDRLLRVAFPADVPGGLPVYQTATAVIGRTPGAADVDVAEHAWTLDNPSQEWFGAGSTARVARAGGPGAGPRLTAIGVAEVVAPDAGRPVREPVRDLMLALARVGVTGTCTLAGGPRYGSIDLDSNLPDVRIALGGPAENAFTAGVLAAAGPGAAADLAAQLAASGTARVWVPASRSRAAAFAPGADPGGPDGLPVLIVAGTDLPAAIGALAADLADAVIDVPASTGPASTGLDGPEPDLAPRSVALLHRGTPGSLVSPDGTLYLALMRACSSWPSGVWIDGEKRTVPDGSSFAFQHWSHTFEYALAAGPGDWREAGFAFAGQDYNRDLIAVPAVTHPGPRPAAASLASAEPATALISALKPHGNPLTPAGQPGRDGGVTIRLRDLSGSGRPTAARVRLHPGLAAAAVTDLCERPAGPPAVVRDGAAEVEVPAAGLVTLAAQLAGPALAPASADPASPASSVSGRGEDETAQPVFSRYWLHNKGPAPAGNLPVAVHLSPGRSALHVPGEPGLAAGPAQATLRLTVAGGTDPAAGEVRLAVPAPLTVTPAGPFRFELPARGSAGWDLTVTAPDPAAGRGARYYVAAGTVGPDGTPVEDAVLVTVGETAAPALDLPLDDLLPLYLADQAATTAELGLRLLTPALTLAPGDRTAVRAELANTTGGPVRGEAELIAPLPGWTVAPAVSQGFALDPGQVLTLSFPLAVPATARPGEHWWALVKVGYFGRLRYSETASVVIAG